MLSKATETYALGDDLLILGNSSETFAITARKLGSGTANDRR